MSKKSAKTSPFIIFLGVLNLVAITVFSFLLSYRFFSNNSTIPLGQDAFAPQVYIAEHQSTEENTIETTMVAQKVNLQRKLIVPQSAADRAAIEQAIIESGGEVVESNSSVVVANLPKETERTLEESLQEQELVEAFEVDYPVYLTADTVDWGVEKIEIPPVWETTQGEGVKVAIVDTGIDYNHPDLQGRYVGGYDFVNDDSDPMDDHGHGTHVSGVVAANANGTGIQGAASQATLAGIKVLDSSGLGYISDIVEAIDWSIANNVQVINMSLGTTYNSSILEQKLDEAQASGIISVAAAGNTSGGSLLYPAAYNSVIAVAATDQNDNFASFSSVGAEVAAPGVSVTSTVPGGGYASWSGTSMASPHVAGSIALMIANEQSDVRTRIQETALDLGEPGKDAYFGYGRVVAKPAVLGEDVLAPVVTFISPEDGSEVGKQLTVKLDIQDENKVVAATISANLVEIASLVEEPYTFEFDASAYVGEELTLVARAIDDSENLGAVQVKVSVVENFEATPTPTATPVIRSDGQSGEVRQDVGTPADEVRQDTNNTPPIVPREIPSGSNINERNQQPAGSASTESSEETTSENKKAAPVELPEQAINNQESGSDNSQRGAAPSVRGATTENVYLLLLDAWLRENLLKLLPILIS